MTDMTDDEFERLCQIGHDQREATRGYDMMPVILLFTPTGTHVNGLGGPVEMWPAAFEYMRLQFHPTGVVLTADIFLRIPEDDEPVTVRPKDDPKAGSAIAVFAAIQGEPLRRRIMPYAVNDDGSFTWLEDHAPIDSYGEITDALDRMVNP